MFNAYAKRPSTFSNSAIMSGAIAMTVTLLSTMIAVMVG